MHAIERELKFQLTEYEFEKLVKFSADKESPLRQTNYYFDTPSFCLEKKGVTLRIRNENNAWLLCLKSKLRHQSSITTSLELQTTVTEAVYLNCKNQPMRVFEYLDPEAKDIIFQTIADEPLIMLGHIANIRYHMPISNQYVIELDHSQFPGDVEMFEAEVEGIVNSTETDYVIHYLSQVGISIKYSSKSKYKRFVESLLGR